jgi:formylglycine-generating enzyme required for sulfatase activity
MANRPEIALPAAGNRSSDVKAAMRFIPGGAFRMGSNDHYPEEEPAHRVRVDGFWMDETPVTNRQFSAFVAAAGALPEQLEQLASCFPAEATSGGRETRLGGTSAPASDASGFFQTELGRVVADPCALQPCSPPLSSAVRAQVASFAAAWRDAHGRT